MGQECSEIRRSTGDRQPSNNNLGDGPTEVKWMGSNFNLLLSHERNNQNNNWPTFIAKDVTATQKVHSYYYPSYVIHVDLPSLGHAGPRYGMAERRRSCKQHHSLPEPEKHWRAVSREQLETLASVKWSCHVGQIIPSTESMASLARPEWQEGEKRKPDDAGNLIFLKPTHKAKNLLIIGVNGQLIASGGVANTRRGLLANVIIVVYLSFI